MLRGGGASGALALKGRLGRLRKRGSTQDKLGSGSGGRKSQLLGRGKGFRRGKAASRPPVQHAESLSSGEGTKESGSTSIASGDDMRSLPSSGGVSSPGRLTTSSSEGDDDDDDDDDDQEALDNKRRRANNVRGGARNTNSTSPPVAGGKVTSQANQLRTGLLRLTRRRSRQLREPMLSAPSDSSSTTSPRGKGGEAENSGVAGSPGGRISAGASLLESRPDRGEKISRGSPDGPGRRKRDVDSSRRRQGTPTGTGISAGGGDSGGESPTWSPRNDEAPLRERRKLVLPPWRSLARGWGRLEDTGENEVAVVSGVGRPAAGMVENVMYDWFGGVVGRAWPGVGLAMRPVVSEVDAHKVCSVGSTGRHVLQTALSLDRKLRTTLKPYRGASCFEKGCKLIVFVTR